MFKLGYYYLIRQNSNDPIIKVKKKKEKNQPLRQISANNYDVCIMNFYERQ